MYVPRAFLETDPDRLAQLIRAHGFGELVTVQAGAPSVSHLPFLYEPDEGPRGTLYAHVARANDHWRQGDTRALAIFTGPHHYISPTWYAEAGTVPTWNYVAVHVRGALQWLDDDAARRDVVTRMVAFYEAGQPEPWTADLDAPELQPELRGIVPLRIAVESIEGKWKLNQHHSLERRRRTARALRALPSENAQAVAALMEASLAHGSHDANRS
jgi:transcriptional regulator